MSSDSIHERSEAEFRAMTNAVPAIIWTGNANGEKVYLNARWYEYTGQTMTEARGAGWTLALHPDDRARIVSYWKRCCSTGDAYEGECRYRRHDGEYRWHEFRAAPSRNSAGRIDGWYGISIDITDRKRLEELFRDNWDRLRLAWQATGDILWDWDIENGSLRLNYIDHRPYDWMDMEGSAPQSIQWLFNRIHPDDLPRIKHGIMNAIIDQSQTHWLDECRIGRPDGMKEMKALFRGYVCRSATGTARRMVGSLQDLTCRLTHGVFTK
jgi:PAS domain S-box-containing protein